MDRDSKSQPSSLLSDGLGWEDAAARALTVGLNATAAQRLQWLEEMIIIAFRSGALPRPHGADE